MSSAKAITAALRGSWRGSYGMVPCPAHNDREPSCKVTDDPRKSDGVDVICFAGCEWRDIKSALRRQGLIEEFDREKPAQLGRVWSQDATKPQPLPEPEPDPEALAIWQKAEPITGTVAERYLTEHRKLSGPFPPSLRFTTALYPRAGLHLPALVAAVVRSDRKLTAVQLTFLTADGRKSNVTAPRWTVGKLGAGAVHVAPVVDVMGLAEGVETALAAMQLTGIPTWATLGAKRMSRIKLPPSVRQLHLFRDNDEPGLEAGRIAAEHYSKQGVRISLRNPPKEFDDYNSVVMTLKQGCAA